MCVKIHKNKNPNTIKMYRNLVSVFFGTAKLRKKNDTAKFFALFFAKICVCRKKILSLHCEIIFGRLNEIEIEGNNKS